MNNPTTHTASNHSVQRASYATKVTHSPRTQEAPVCVYNEGTFVSKTIGIFLCLFRGELQKLKEVVPRLDLRKLMQVSHHVCVCARVSVQP